MYRKIWSESNSITGIHNKVRSARTTHESRPTSTNSRSEAWGRKYGLYKSRHMREAEAVKTESSDDMQAATVAASIKPSIPFGNSRAIIIGSA
eukprot:scaffold155640_cov30-Tisochrysis_lutea.AAC.1